MTKKEESAIEDVKEQKIDTDKPKATKAKKEKVKQEEDTNKSESTGPSKMPDLQEVGQMAKTMSKAVVNSAKAIVTGVKEVVADYKEKRTGEK